MKRPGYLKQGEEARLFPVLSTTSKEGRTASIVLACLAKVDEFGRELLASVGTRVGRRTTIVSFTEVVFQGQKGEPDNRPDGLIVVSTGSREWRALVEAKIGGERLKEDQIEKYRTLAKENGIDCVITISNQFATSPDQHPLEAINKSRSKIPVYHWSWMFMLTVAELLISNKDVADTDQQVLLYELCRFLAHDSAGVKGFDRMPREWSELNKLVSAGGKIPSKSIEAETVVKAWHQETKDLSLILSRQTDTAVSQKLTRQHQQDANARFKDELANLRENNVLNVCLDIPNAAAPLDILADIGRRTIEIGMTVRAPEDKKSGKARMNWLLRQIKSEDVDDVYVRCNWPGRSDSTQFSIADLLEDSSICEEGKEGLSLLSFDLFAVKRLGTKFTQQLAFISELEALVPWFYREFGQNLTEWRKPAPKISPRHETNLEIDLERMAEDLDD